MPHPENDAERGGRHAGGHRRLVSRQDARRAGVSGLVMGIAFTVAEVFSRLLFNRDFEPEQGWHGFITSVASLWLAIIAVMLPTALVAEILKRRRTRLRGHDGPASSS
jgi:uncharacterized membrane protein